MLKGTDRPTAIKFRLIDPQKGWDYAQGTHHPQARRNVSKHWQGC